MPKNHAKAIKGMSIACIAIAGVIILVCLAGLAMIALFGPIIEEAIMDSYAYDYGYGYDFDYDSIFGAYGLSAALEPVHGMHDHVFSSYYPYAYDDLDDLQVLLTMGNVLLVLGLIAEGIVLAAGIIVLRNHNKPEKFGTAFVWSIVGAVIGFFAAGIVQAVLFIIIAVFVNSDKKLYQAGMYSVPVPGVPGAVSAYPPQQPVPPMAPNAPGTPVVPAVPGAPVAQPPAQPMQPAQPVAASPQAAQPTQGVTTAEVFQPASQSSLAPGGTQPPAPGEAVATGVVVSEATVGDAAIVEAAQVEAPVASETEAPVVVDEGAVIKLDASGDQPFEE